MFVITVKREDTEYYLIRTSPNSHDKTLVVEKASKYTTFEDAKQVWKELSLEVIYSKVDIVKL